MKTKKKNSKKRKDFLRKIPAIDKILNMPELEKYREKIEPTYLTKIVRDQVERVRSNLRAGKDSDSAGLIKDIVQELHDLTNPYFRYAINGLGIVLHTGLGRAPYSGNIAEALQQVAIGYSRLQIDDEGKRADRYRKINRLLQILTGAEAGIFVNNNAAATLLILNTVAKDKEVIISRGQLIEIGGSFRIPDVMAQSGAIMREIGTTNRTHLKDYEQAINDKTGAIIRVHQSNYRMSGFIKEVSLEELVELGTKYKIPVIDDLGSGALIDFSKYGLPKEPMVQESVSIGATVICFSGDKLIGGPQAGIIIGKKNYIEKIKKNPLTRALRCDKLTSAALESTLQLFLKHEGALIHDHSICSILLKLLPEIKERAEKCADGLKQFSTSISFEVKSSVSEIGGGSLSTEQLPTFVLALRPKAMKVAELARALRQYRIPIFGRIERDSLLLDFRTILEGEENIIVNALGEILTNDDAI